MRLRIRAWALQHQWSTDRTGRLLAGASVALVVSLAAVHSPWWLLACAPICINLMQSAITDRCVVKDLLIRLGLPTERELGPQRGDSTGRRASPPSVQGLGQVSTAETPSSPY